MFARVINESLCTLNCFFIHIDIQYTHNSYKRIRRSVEVEFDKNVYPPGWLSTSLIVSDIKDKYKF